MFSKKTFVDEVKAIHQRSHGWAKLTLWIAKNLQWGSVFDMQNSPRSAADQQTFRLKKCIRYSKLQQRYN